MLDSNKVKEMLSVDDIIKICCFLQGSDEFYYDDEGRPIFNTCLDHSDGDSFKLYYFPDTHLFNCWTRGSTYDIFELVKRAQDFEEFSQSYRFVVKFFSLKDDGNNVISELTDDWSSFRCFCQKN